MKKKILLTGSNGYIAKSIYESLQFDFEIFQISRKNFNLENFLDVHNFFKNQYFDIVIHTAIQGGSRLNLENNSQIEKNLKMYYNLLDHKKYFNKLINIGSGAEFYSHETPYSLSKKIIARSIDCHDNFYNLRIFGIFDHNELDTRFIKSNILRYKKLENIIIHKNKFMDFIHMKDFIKILEHYLLSTNNLPKHINCVYNTKYSLNDIGKIINTLSSNKVNIQTSDDGLDNNYTGQHTDLGLQLDTLENRIFQTYRILMDL